MKSKRQKKRDKASAVNMLAYGIREFVALKTGIDVSKHPNLTICDCCGRYPGGEENYDGEYCHLRETSKMPDKGYCDGLVPVEGITISENEVSFGRTFLDRLLQNKEAV
ncbi:MAG: hypothetical protein JKX80_01325 [Candidatus Pacebacteria bacterium]|nr:hypothetical protein [Candidatus Paceibacterota bacterium]